MLEFNNHEEVGKKEDPLTRQIIGAAIEVHRRLGPGFLEKVYQEALAVEMSYRGIPFQKELTLPVIYRNVQLPTVYRADFVCFDSIIVELKAVSCLCGKEGAQVLHYLKATGLHKALLLNFGEEQGVVVKRYIA